MTGIDPAGVRIPAADLRIRPDGLRNGADIIRIDADKRRIVYDIG